jgi:signal transduction histidine kinase
MVWNWLRRHPWIVDTAIVVGLAAIFVGRAVHLDRFPGGVLLALASLVPLLVRRRYPLAVLVIVSAAWLATEAVYSLEPPVAPAVALYTLVARDGRVRALPAGAALGAVTIVVSAAVGSWGHLAWAVLLLCGAFVLGDNHATRRAELESDRARAVAEEQARIGRELHDVIAHNVSVMVVQAAAGNDVFDERPDQARAALQSIEETGRRALGELRRLLDVVADDEAGRYDPQPGLGRLGDLVESVRSTGLGVELIVEGSPKELSPALELSAFRIVQEALTNTLKHARASRALVRVRYAADALELEVADDGVGGASADGGRGLVGMRERVALFGGDLAAGARPEGGFAVRARMPLESS